MAAPKSRPQNGQCTVKINRATAVTSPTFFSHPVQTISIASPRSTRRTGPNYSNSRARFKGAQNPVARIFPRESLLRLMEITLQQSLVLFPLEIRLDFPNQRDNLVCRHG